MPRNRHNIPIYLPSGIISRAGHRAHHVSFLSNSCFLKFTRTTHAWSSLLANAQKALGSVWNP